MSDRFIEVRVYILCGVFGWFGGSFWGLIGLDRFSRGFSGILGSRRVGLSREGVC